MNVDGYFLPIYFAIFFKKFTRVTIVIHTKWFADMAQLMLEYDIHIVVFFVNAKINTYKLPGVTESMFVVVKIWKAICQNAIPMALAALQRR